MPRASKDSKFFHQVPRKTGGRKGQIFFGRNHRYEGEVTLQDLFDYMKENEIDPAKVQLNPMILLWAKT